MTFGLQCDEPAAVAILDRAAAGGITFLDVLDGKISTAAEYGVVLTPDGAAVDEVKTKECREALAGRRGAGG